MSPGNDVSLRTRPGLDGFTLIEMVVVVTLVGILAATAVLSLVDVAEDARESALRRDLGIVRQAIELHRARVGSLPGDAGTAADFKADLVPFLPRFPRNPFGDDSVLVKSDGLPMAVSISPRGGWRYDCTSGEFIANTNSMSSDGIRRHHDL